MASAEMSSKPKCIIVTGRPGSGKTSLAKRLAEQLWMPVIKRLVVDQGSRNPYTASEYENRFRDWLWGDEWSVDIFEDSEGVTLGYAVHTVQQDYYYPDQEVSYEAAHMGKQPNRTLGT